MGFSTLKQGRKLIAYINAYNTWEELEPGAKQARYEALNVQRFTYTKQNVYIAPFNIAGFNLFVQAVAPAAGQNQPTPTLLTLAAGRFQTEAPTTAGVTIVTDNSIFAVGKLAKLTLKQRIQDATQKIASRITTARYYRHQNNSASMPFGKSAANDTFATALAAIKANAAYDNFLDTRKGNAVTVKPEGST